MNLFKRNFPGGKNRQNESPEDSGCAVAEVKIMLAQACGASPFLLQPQDVWEGLQSPH